MNERLKLLNLSRNKINPIGKKMGNQLWFHKNYAIEILGEAKFNSFKSIVPKEFEYEVLRWDSKKEELAFIECFDFNISNEPIVGKVLRVLKKEKSFELLKVVNQPKDPLIYHHKWMFVKDDYQYFSVKESKKRSLEWKEVLGKNKSLSSKIGRLSFWDNWLEDNKLSKRIN